MERKRFRVALIGYRFMGKLHSNAYRLVQHLMDPPVDLEMAVLCGRDLEQVSAAAKTWGWQEASVDWRSSVARPDIDAVDIAVPGDAHAEIAQMALRYGKHVLCEKPLANSLDESLAMVNAAEQSNAVHMIGFNYRRAPAIQLARQLLDQGKLGHIFHVRGQYLQDWAIDPMVPLTWRFDKSLAGSGSLGDLLAHVVDLTRYLVGEFDSVTALQHRFIENRPRPASLGGSGLGHAGDSSSEFGPVTVDDATAVLATLSGGAVGVFEATRFATGYKNALRLEIHGERGAIRFDLERLNELEYYAVEPDAPAQQGFRKILATHPDHPYMQYWWPEGHVVGYEVTFAHQIRDWLVAVASGSKATPDFTDGLRCQEVLTAIDESSAARRTIDVSHHR